MKTKVMFISALVLLLACATAFAAPFTSENTRPVPVTIPSPDGSGKDVQTMLNTIFGAGIVNAVTDQKNAGMWGLTTFPLVSAPVIAFEYSGLDAHNAIGLWSDADMDTATAPTRLEIFKGTATPGTVATLAWNVATGVLEITGNANVNTGSFAAFGGINPLDFGIYLDNTDNGGLPYPKSIWYSVDALNGGEAHALAYRLPTGGTWALAFEDLPFAVGDEDYNDIVIKMESIEAVPEPGTMLLLGCGLIGLAGVARRRFTK